MAEPDHKPHMDEQEGSAPTYTPASFEKRTAAWMGIAYALMFLFIITFSMYTAGQRSLAGTFPLFLVPVTVALIVIAIHRQRKGKSPGGMAGTVVTVLLCAVLAGAGLWLGLPPLIAAFAG